MVKKQKKKRKQKPLNIGMLIFMFCQLFVGLIIFFASLKFIELSPYREIASILGIVVSLTSGIKVTFSNIFKDWTSQD